MNEPLIDYGEVERRWRLTACTQTLRPSFLFLSPLCSLTAPPKIGWTWVDLGLLSDRLGKTLRDLGKTKMDMGRLRKTSVRFNKLGWTWLDFGKLGWSWINVDRVGETWANLDKHEWTCVDLARLG